MAEVATSMLNFADKRRKGVSSRAYRVKTPSSNGTSFSASQTIRIDLPTANQANTYMDFSNSYLSFQLTNGDGAAVALSGGITDMILKVEAVVGSQTLFSIDQYGVLASMLLDMDTSAQFKNNAGRVLLGTNTLKGTGFSIGAGSTKQFCIPLFGNCLFNTNKYIPCFAAENISLRIHLNSAVLGSVGDATDAELTFSQCEFVSYMVELSPEAQNLVNQSVGGVYEILADDYRHASGSLAAAQTSSVITTGFSFSSLNRVLVAFRNDASLVAGRSSIACRGNPTISRASISVNGQKIPAREIQELATATGSLGGAETLAELLVADRALSSFSHDSSINANSGDAFTFTTATATGVVAAETNIGSYMLGIDTEALRGDVDKVYSGINTISAVVQGEFEFSGNPGACQVNMYANYTTRIVLDTNGLRTFEVRV